jgi:hypothetical protein
MVPVEGIEPTLLAEHDFESCASTSSATRARPASISSEGVRVYWIRLHAGRRLRSDLRSGWRFAGKVTCKSDLQIALQIARYRPGLAPRQAV